MYNSKKATIHRQWLMKISRVKRKKRNKFKLLKTKKIIMKHQILFWLMKMGNIMKKKEARLEMMIATMKTTKKLSGS